MSDSETMYNLIPDTEGLALSATVTEGTRHYEEVVLTDNGAVRATRSKGDSFTLSFEVRRSSAGMVCAYLYNSSGNTRKNAYVDGSLQYSGSFDGYVKYDAGPEWRWVAITWVYIEDPKQPIDYVIPARLLKENTAAGTTVEVRNLMMVRGTEPVAWAPAEGEEIAGGGGALMSDNLLEGATLVLNGKTSESDGIYHYPASSGHIDMVWYSLAGQTALAANQTYHMGVSAKGASADADSLYMIIGYKDAAGKSNWVGTPYFKLGTSWQRFEGTVVVPAGMTPFAAYVTVNGEAPELWLSEPSCNLGIYGVTIAVEAHTAYATHAALNVTADAIEGEVKERKRTDENVKTANSKITQLSNSITSLVKGETTYTAPDGLTKANALATKVQQTAKDVTTAIDTANGTAMLIRSDSTGVTVGKSTDGGKTFSSGRTHIDSDSFDVLDNDGNVVATLSKNTLSLLAGMFKIKTEVQTPDGGTAEYYDTIISDGDVTFGDGYIDRSYIEFESRLADDWKKRDSIVNIQSASGDGIGGSSLSVSPSGIALSGEVKVEGEPGASGLQIGGNGTTIAGLFFGSKVVSANAGEARLWTPSEFESAFGRKFDFTRDYVGVMNADASVNGGYGVSVATYWSSGNIWVGGSGVVAGPIRVNYLVILGE